MRYHAGQGNVGLSFEVWLLPRSADPSLMVTVSRWRWPFSIAIDPDNGYSEYGGVLGDTNDYRPEDKNSLGALAPSRFRGAVVIKKPPLNAEGLGEITGPFTVWGFRSKAGQGTTDAALMSVKQVL